jgi:hypothetical protein
MAIISQQQISKLSQYFSIIHHTKGRIRLAISPKIMQLQQEFKTLNISLDKAKEFVKNIDGIKEFKFIALLGTVTIIYDSDIFNVRIIEDFINAQNLEHVTEFINTLIDKFNIAGG